MFLCPRRQTIRSMVASPPSTFHVGAGLWNGSATCDVCTRSTRRCNQRKVEPLGMQTYVTISLKNSLLSTRYTSNVR